MADWPMPQGMMLRDQAALIARDLLDVVEDREKFGYTATHVNAQNQRPTRCTKLLEAWLFSNIGQPWIESQKWC
jgi:hypothetical protein